MKKVGLVNRIFVFVRGLSPQISTNYVEFGVNVAKELMPIRAIQKSLERISCIKISKNRTANVCTNFTGEVSLCQTREFSGMEVNTSMDFVVEV